MVHDGTSRLDIPAPAEFQRKDRDSVYDKRGHTIADMKIACRGAAFAHEKEIQFDSNGGDHLETPMQEIKAWIAAICADETQEETV